MTMDDLRLQIRGDIQIQLAKAGYELRRIRKDVERIAEDRAHTEAEEKVLQHASEALKALRQAQDHAELVGFYLEEVNEDIE
ncbi:MAG: hypothetical protein ACE5JI_01425 [Acidobacteriota bacterium]